MLKVASDVKKLILLVVKWPQHPHYIVLLITWNSLLRMGLFNRYLITVLNEIFLFLSIQFNMLIKKRKYAHF